MVESHRPSDRGRATQNHGRTKRHAQANITTETAVCSEGKAARLSTGRREKASAFRREKNCGYP